MGSDSKHIFPSPSFVYSVTGFFKVATPPPAGFPSGTRSSFASGGGRIVLSLGVGRHMPKFWVHPNLHGADPGPGCIFFTPPHMHLISEWFCNANQGFHTDDVTLKF